MSISSALAYLGADLAEMVLLLELISFIQMIVKGIWLKKRRECSPVSRMSLNFGF